MKRTPKFIVSALLAAAMMATQGFSAFANDSVGDPNIDNGGGALGAGTDENGWYSGHDGVRVTVVDSKTGQRKSISIDYTNKHPDDVAVHFGKQSKAEYRNGVQLSASTSTYQYINPASPLPTIVSNGDYLNANIDLIKSYFTDEQVVRRIGEHTGINYDKLIGGDYKLMLEPIVYLTYNSVKYAMTATEAALLNMKTGGDFINKFAPLSHKNLPLAMFLESDDIGYTAWGGTTTSRVSDSDIINYLGVGIVSFKEPDDEVEVISSEYEYRVDTDVYTSITVTGGRHTPDNPVTVIFNIKNTSYTVSNIVYPEGASQLVWVRWHTPTTPQTVTINVTVEGGAAASRTTILANIVSLDENPPPDPTAYDRNDSFTAVSPPSKGMGSTITVINASVQEIRKRTLA